MNSLYTPFLYHSNYGFGGSNFKTLFESTKQSQENFKTAPTISRDCHALRARNDKELYPFEISATLYLFAKNRQGYVNLCHILTANAFKKY